MNKPIHIFLVIIFTTLFSIFAYSQPSYVKVTSNGIQGETAITADPNNPNHLMATWNDITNGKPGYSFSIDGGESWQSPGYINVSGVDPSCAIDKLYEREYYTFLNGGIYISYSVNDGGNWTSPKLISTINTAQDKPYMAVDNTGGKYNGNVYVVWTNFSNGHINNEIDFAYASKGDWTKWTEQPLYCLSGICGGSSAQSSSQTIALSAGDGKQLQAAIPAVGPDGTVYVVYLYSHKFETSRDTSEILCQKSTDGGASFSWVTLPKQLTNFPGDCNSRKIGTLIVHSYPTIAVDPRPNTGNIYISWMQDDGGTLNIYSIHSTDEGGSWSSPAKLQQVGSENAFFPWLSVNSSGVVSLSYYGENSSNLVDVYVAQSNDNGLTFNSITRMTPTSEDPNNGPNGCDYMGAVSLASGETIPLWTDLSSSSSHIYTTPYFYSGGTTSQSLTIPSGQTAVFAPGATTTFNNGASLIVNGALNANGNSSSTPITFDFGSPSSTAQNGINFNSVSSGTINYCIVRNAYQGIYENNVNINITNSAISNCTNGINLYYSNPLIQYSSIHDNTYGIYLTSSSPVLQWGNHIQNNYYGLYCSTSSNPNLGNGIYDGEDDIRNNTLGVYCWNNSYPIIGHSYGDNNLVNTSYNVYNASSGVVYAQNNWWGTTDPNNFKISGNVNYSPYKTSEMYIPPAPLSKASANQLFASEDIPMLSELDSVYQMISDSNLIAARKLCMNLITNYPDYSVSYNALNLLKDTYTVNEFNSRKNIFTSLFNGKNHKNINAMAGLILSDVDKGNKLIHIDSVLNEYGNDNISQLALFDKFVYYYFQKDDMNSALIISKQLDTQFPNTEGSIEAHKILGDKDYYGMPPKQKQPQNVTNTEPAKEFKLFVNYPNPFNPTTIIKYQIPNNSFVTLKVYDELGRLVKTQVNQYEGRGSYDVDFNGSNLASGVYFYKLEAGNYISIKKMLLLK